MDEIGNMDFDRDAAEKATPQDANNCLRAIKHFIRATCGDEDIDRSVKDFLEFFGIYPGSPYYVVGFYPSILRILKGDHKCYGRKCVLRLNKKAAEVRKTATRPKRKLKKSIIQKIIDRARESKVTGKEKVISKRATKSLSSVNKSGHFSKQDYPTYFI